MMNQPHHGLRDHIQEYLSAAKMMQLVTSAQDRPWVCNVWFASDPDFNLYWFSSVTRRHSHELIENPRVAASICMVKNPEDQPQALQIEGLAAELVQSEDVAVALKYYVGRVFDMQKIKELMAHPQKPHKFYRLKPERIVMFDAVNFPEDPLRELVIEQENV